MADYHATVVGLVDKPCWVIDGPEGFQAIMWDWTIRNEQQAIRVILQEYWPGTRMITKKAYFTP